MSAKGPQFIIGPCTPLRPDIESLARHARREGCRCVDRLIDDWRSGANRFDRTGERLLAAFLRDAVVSVGGLNVDPYVGNSRCGRLRHLYVDPAHRGRDIGHRLVAALIKDPQHAFDRIRLRATEESNGFYDAVGFAPSSDTDATHVLHLR